MKNKHMFATQKILCIFLTMSLILNILLVFRIPQKVYHSLNKNTSESLNYTIYNIRADVFRNIDYPSNVDILFVGDSITDNCDYNSLFPEYTIVNQGVNNDGIYGLSKRTDCIVKANPKYVFIEIGINDIVTYGSDTLVDDYSNIVDLLSEQLPSSLIYIESIYPVNADSEYSKHIDTIQNINSKLISLTHDNIKYLDIYSDLVIANDIYISDGLHLNQNGYNIVANKIKQELSKEGN